MWDGLWVLAQRAIELPPDPPAIIHTVEWRPGLTGDLGLVAMATPHGRIVDVTKPSGEAGTSGEPASGGGTSRAPVQTGPGMDKRAKSGRFWPLGRSHASDPGMMLSVAVSVGAVAYRRREKLAKAAKWGKTVVNWSVDMLTGGTIDEWRNFRHQSLGKKAWMIGYSAVSVVSPALKLTGKVGALAGKWAKPLVQPAGRWVTSKLGSGLKQVGGYIGEGARWTAQKASPYVAQLGNGIAKRLPPKVNGWLSRSGQAVKRTAATLGRGIVELPETVPQLVLQVREATRHSLLKLSEVRWVQAVVDFVRPMREFFREKGFRGLSGFFKWSPFNSGLKWVLEKSPEWIKPLGRVVNAFKARMVALKPVKWFLDSKPADWLRKAKVGVLDTIDTMLTLPKSVGSTILSVSENIMKSMLDEQTAKAFVQNAHKAVVQVRERLAVKSIKDSLVVAKDFFGSRFRKKEKEPLQAAE